MHAEDHTYYGYTVLCVYYKYRKFREGTVNNNKHNNDEQFKLSLAQMMAGLYR